MLTKLWEIRLLVFFISCFTISVTPSINTPKSSNDFIILIISFISSLKTNKVNPFPALIVPFPLIFLSNLFIAFEVKLLTNTAKLSLAKGIAMFVSPFFPKLPNQKSNDSPDWIILDIWVLLSFISADLLLAKACLILVGFLVVRNNSYANSSSSKCVLFILIFSSLIFLLQILICLTVYLLI